MNNPSKRVTIYFEPTLHHALRLKAATTHRTISELVNDALRESLREDQEDLSAFRDRSRNRKSAMRNCLRI